MTTSRQSLGRWGEALAASYLVDHGYSIFERNIRTPYGEIDLITYLGKPGTDRPVEPGGVMVFVEVKTRATKTYGYPEASVTLRKQTHLLDAVQYYLQQHPELDCDWRIDVIAIERLDKNQPPLIHQFENALGQS